MPSAGVDAASMPRASGLYAALVVLVTAVAITCTLPMASAELTGASSLVTADPRIAWVQDALRASLHQLDVDQCGSEEKHPCGGRDFSNGAVSAYLLSGGANASGAMHWLSKVQPGGSFVGQGFCALAHEGPFMAGLNTSSRAWVVSSINKALPGLAVWNATDVSYSNMYFMGMVNAIICGEAPGVDPAAGAMSAAHGYALVNDWLRYAADAQNHEFTSPTYYWVQMNALSLGCMYAKDPRGKAALCGILEHVWADVAANWFEPTETVSGPHSRDYDLLFGHGAVQVITYVNGLGTHHPVCEYKDAHCERTNDGQNALVLLNVVHARDGSGIGFTPKPSTLALSKLPVREVRSHFLGQARTANNQSTVASDRYNYIVSGRYSIGSVGAADYITNTHLPYYPGPQDKLVNINLAVPNMTQYRPVPAVTIVPDWMNSPYGHWYEPHTDKPSHLASHPGNVQHRNVLLATQALNPTEQCDGFNCTVFDSLATNLVMPHVNVSNLVVDGKATPLPSATAPFAMTLRVGSSVGIRVSQSCMVARLFAADVAGSGGGGDGEAGEAVVQLKGDADGLDLGAMRLVAYHYQGPNRTLPSNTHVKSGFLIVVDECADAGALATLAAEVADAPLSSVVDSSHTWTVTALVRGTTLEVTRDVSEPHCLSWGCVTRRAVNGTTVTPVPLSVNGQVVVPIPKPFK